MQTNFVSSCTGSSTVDNARQPAEAEGVSNARLMNTLAELARRAPLRTLHTICETQRQVSTVKLERYLEPVGDTLAGYAFTLRIDFNKLSAALSAVTAERDALKHALDVKEEFYQDALHSHIVLAQQRDQLRAEVEAMRKDAERYRWVSSGLHEAETLVSIVNCHGGYAEKVAERVDVYREAAMAAKEA